MVAGHNSGYASKKQNLVVARLMSLMLVHCQKPRRNLNGSLLVIACAFSYLRASSVGGKPPLGRLGGSCIYNSSDHGKPVHGKKLKSSLFPFRVNVACPLNIKSGHAGFKGG